MITKAQAVALAKWRKAPCTNWARLDVRYDLVDRLMRKGLIEYSGFMVRSITPEGLKALEEYEAKHG